MSEEKNKEAVRPEDRKTIEVPGQKAKRPRTGRYQYGPFRVFVDSFCKGEAYLNLVSRKHQRMYMVVTIYEWGRWPRFTKKGGFQTFIIEMPKAGMIRAVKRLKKSGVRIRKLPTAKWHEKFFRIDG